MNRPRKRFGQNFLHDAAVIERIVRAINPRPDQAAVEIGPGRAAITVPLLAAFGELDVIEIDRDLVAALRNRFPPGSKLRVHENDALRFDFRELAKERGQKLRVIGNLPYNISTPLLFHLLDQADAIEDMHFMLQKEVVDRMAARTGQKAYGRLTVMLAQCCRVESLFTVGPGAFKPPPKVESAVVRVIPLEPPPLSVRDHERFARIVNQAFSQRRKTLRNAVKGLASEAMIEAAGLKPTVRPEQVTPEQFAQLADIAVP